MTESFNQPLKDSGGRTDFGTGSVRDSKTGKGRYDLLPTRALHAIAQHFEKGAAKYGDRNWEQGQPISNYLDSALRHTFQYLGGYRDEPHLISGAWNLLCAIDTLVRIDEGILPERLNDLPTFTAEEAKTMFINEAGVLSYDPRTYNTLGILQALEASQIDADQSPDDTLARLIAERDRYKSAYQQTFEVLTSITSHSSPVAEAFNEVAAEDAQAAAAYEQKAEEIYNESTVSEALQGAIQRKGCGCSHGGCEIDIQPLPLVQFTIFGDPDGIVYSWDENSSVIHWKSHTHRSGQTCPAGSSTIKCDRTEFEYFVATNEWIVVA